MASAGTTTSKRQKSSCSVGADSAMAVATPVRPTTGSAVPRDNSQLPKVMTLLLTELRSRAATRDTRVASNAQSLSLLFLHPGSQRCWSQILAVQAAVTVTRSVGGKDYAVKTPSSLQGLHEVMDVYSPDHPCQRGSLLLPKIPYFFSATVLDAARARARVSSGPSKGKSLMETLGDVWLKYRGEFGLGDSVLPTKETTQFYVASWERRHWLVESSIILGLHPSLNEDRSESELAEILKLWHAYCLDRKRRSDVLRLQQNNYVNAILQSAKHEAQGEPAPRLDAEIIFDPSIPLPSRVNLPWFPSTADWVGAVEEIDDAEHWRVWWLLAPHLHPYYTMFLPRNPGFPVFVQDGGDVQRTENQIQADVDTAEAAPRQAASGAPTPVNRLGASIFRGSTLLLGQTDSATGQVVSASAEPPASGTSPTDDSAMAMLATAAANASALSPAQASA